MQNESLPESKQVRAPGTRLVHRLATLAVMWDLVQAVAAHADLVGLIRLLMALCCILGNASS
eukprot:1159887-Pelagomonas_calceolata.AAC.2